MKTVLKTLRLAIPALFVASVLPAQDEAPAVVTKFTSDFGYVATSGNTAVTTMSVGEKLTQSRNRLTLEQTFALVYGEQDGIVNTNNLRAGLRADYRVDRLFAIFGGAAFDRNTFAGIERRFEEQIGVQYRALAATRDTIRVEGGGSITQQIAVGGGQTNFPSARAAGVWRHHFTPASYFQQNVEYLPNLSTPIDWRINTESSVVAPISARIGVKVSYVIRYDNLPEVGFRTTDRLFTTGVQLTY
jgi:putative salt-induced outer membrane protein